MNDTITESLFVFDHTDQPISEIMSLANTNVWFDGIDLVEDFYTTEAEYDTKGTLAIEPEHYGLLAVAVDNDNQTRPLRGNRSANLQKPIYRRRNINTGIQETPLTFSISFVLIKQEDSWYDSWGGRSSVPESMRKTWVRANWTEETLSAFARLFGQNDFKKLIFGAEKLRPDKNFYRETDFTGPRGEVIEPYFGNIRGFHIDDYKEYIVDGYNLNGNTYSFYHKKAYWGTQYDKEGKYNFYSQDGAVGEDEKRYPEDSSYYNEGATRNDPLVEGFYYDEYNAYYYNKAGYDIDDLSPLYFNVIPMIGSQTDLSVFEGNHGYITVGFQCDAPHGWVDLHKNLRYCQPVRGNDAEIGGSPQDIEGSKSRYLAYSKGRNWGLVNPADIMNSNSEWTGYGSIFIHNFSHLAKNNATLNDKIHYRFAFNMPVGEEDIAGQDFWGATNLKIDTTISASNHSQVWNHGFVFDLNNKQVYTLDKNGQVVTDDDENILEKITYSNGSDIKDGWIYPSTLDYIYTSKIWFPTIYKEGYSQIKRVANLDKAFEQAVEKDWSTKYNTDEFNNTNNIYEAELCFSFPCSAKKTSHPQRPRIWREFRQLYGENADYTLLGTYGDRTLFSSWFDPTSDQNFRIISPVSSTCRLLRNSKIEIKLEGVGTGEVTYFLGGTINNQSYITEENGHYYLCIGEEETAGRLTVRFTCTYNAGSAQTVVEHASFVCTLVDNFAIDVYKPNNFPTFYGGQYLLASTIDSGIISWDLIENAEGDDISSDRQNPVLQIVDGHRTDSLRIRGQVPKLVVPSGAEPNWVATITERPLTSLTALDASVGGFLSHWKDYDQIEEDSEYPFDLDDYGNLYRDNSVSETQVILNADNTTNTISYSFENIESITVEGSGSAGVEWGIILSPLPEKRLQTYIDSNTLLTEQTGNYILQGTSPTEENNGGINETFTLTDEMRSGKRAFGLYAKSGAVSFSIIRLTERKLIENE